jgi:hypothetical protein
MQGCSTPPSYTKAHILSMIWPGKTHPDGAPLSSVEQTPSDPGHLAFLAGPPCGKPVKCQYPPEIDAPTRDFAGVF